MAKMNVKKGDHVLIIAGKSRGKDGDVLRAYPREGKVKVEGMNIVKKAQKPNQENQNGGFLEVEAKIDASNVMLICPKCGKATRVGHAKDELGNKVRVCKKCGAQF